MKEVQGNKKNILKEKNGLEKMISKDKSVPLLIKKVSIFIFIWPIILFIAIAFYIKENNLVVTDTKFTIILILAALFFSMPAVLKYINYSILIKEDAIIVKNGNKELINWNIIKDFAYISYNNKAFRLGAFLNYSTISIMNRKKEMYSFKYISGASEIFELVKKLNIEYTKKINPDFEFNPNQRLKDSIKNLEDNWLIDKD